MRFVNTKASILALLARSNKAVETGILRLFERQTLDERESEDTKHLNKKGFSYANAEDGCRMGKLIKAVIDAYTANGLTEADAPLGSILPADDRERALEICQFHAWQLAMIANGKISEAA